MNAITNGGGVTLFLIPVNNSEGISDKSILL